MIWVAMYSVYFKIIFVHLISSWMSTNKVVVVVVVVVWKIDISQTTRAKSTQFLFNV